jgi:RNA polymerase sigma factor (sigma-70 family)
LVETIGVLISKIKTREAAEELLNDSSKFSKFAEKNKKFLMSILSRVKDKDNYDEEDLYQESLIALHSALQSYDPEERIRRGKKSASFSTYSFVLIKNEIVHYINEQNKIVTCERSIERFRETMEELAPHKPNAHIDFLFGFKDEGFEDAVIKKIDQDKLLAKLSTTEKLIFDKKIVKNMTHDEVAADLGIPAATYMTIYYKSFVPKVRAMGVALINKR